MIVVVVVVVIVVVVVVVVVVVLVVGVVVVEVNVQVPLISNYFAVIERPYGGIAGVQVRQHSPAYRY